MSDSLQPHGLQHARPPCPSPTPGAYSNSCLSRQWCHPTISSSVVPFSSRLQSFPASGSFPMSLFFASGGQSIGVSASALVLPTNIQDWFPLGWTGWISLQSRDSRQIPIHPYVVLRELPPGGLFPSMVGILLWAHLQKGLFSPLGVHVPRTVDTFLQHCFAFLLCRLKLSCFRVLNSSF